MNRRIFLQAATIAGASQFATDSLVGQRSNASSAAAISPGGSLRRVLVHTPGDELLRVVPMYQGEHSMLTWELLDLKELRKQHLGFVDVLKTAGVEVLQFDKLLDEALEVARQKGELVGWLREALPALASRSDEVNAASLIGRDPRFVYTTSPSGALTPLINPATTLWFVRDLAIMTPKGLVLGDLGTKRRSEESVLARFAATHSPTLKRYPLVWDAREDGVRLQGGDVILLDEKTLLLGVGNATAREAAPLLARKLEMDVIAVEMPSQDWMPGQWDGLVAIFYHLDCLINCVGTRQVLAVPYLLEMDSADDNPLLQVLYGMAKVSQRTPAERNSLLEHVRDVGWITRYQGGSGELDKGLKRMKLLDYLRQHDWQCTYVGGELPPQRTVLQHCVERVLRECRFMATNVLNIAPGHIVCYEGNPHTIDALTKQKIQITTFAGSQLVRGNGGPRCLTLPLERSSLMVGK